MIDKILKILEKKKKVVNFDIGEIKPGEGAILEGTIPKADLAEVVLEYGDKYGNTYETKALVNFKDKKILKQEFKKVKIVKDVGENHPQLTIEENSIEWQMVGENDQ